MDAQAEMIDVALGRIVITDGSERQYIYLCECDGRRGFPIVIGNNEASEIHRVVTGGKTQRPLTHELCTATIAALGSTLKRVDIVELRDNTFYAQLVLQDDSGAVTAVVDARPSDAIALALRSQSPIRVNERVLQAACGEENEPPDEPRPEPNEPDEPDEPNEPDEPAEPGSSDE